MLWRERGAILSHHFESRLAWNEKDETSRFALGAGLAEPAVAQLTTECYQSEPPRWAGVGRKRSTDPSEPGRGFWERGWLLSEAYGRNLSTAVCRKLLLLR